MRYYEDKYGLHAVPVLPDRATELTKEQYETRLAEIKAYAEANPPEDIPIDASEIDIDDSEALEIITGGSS